MIAETLLGINLPPSKELQKVHAHIVQCYKEVKVAFGVYEDKRSNSKDEFIQIFNFAQLQLNRILR